MTISAKVFAGIEGILTTSRAGGPATQPFNEGFEKLFTDGTGAGKANGTYFYDFSIAASASENIDLSGTLEDAHGNAMVFTKIKAIMLFAAAGNTNNVILGNVTNGFVRSEEHTSELQSLTRISYAVFCLKTNTKQKTHKTKI